MFGLMATWLMKPRIMLSIVRRFSSFCEMATLSF